LLDQEAKSHKTLVPVLIAKELVTIEAEVANTIDQRFQAEEQEESECEIRERVAKITEKNRIEKEEKEEKAAIEAENNQNSNNRAKFTQRRESNKIKV
jgi:hypothetical protein